jgi:hypothetical protein
MAVVGPAEPTATGGHALRAGERTLANDLAFVRRKTGQQGVVKRPLAVAVSNSSVRPFYAHAALFQFGHGLQCEAGIAARPIQAIDRKLIEPVV